MNDYYDEYDNIINDERVFQEMIQNKSQISFGDINNFYDRIKKQVEELKFLLDQIEDDCLKIYKYYSWNTEKLEANYFDDMEQVQIEAGIIPKQIQQIPDDKFLYCNIACEKLPISDFTYLACQHYFATEMWVEYLNCKISSNMTNPFYKCMQHGCNMIVPESLIIKLVDQNTFQQYKKALGKDYSTLNKKVKICSYPNCFLYAESDDLFKQEIVCKCSYKYCSQCLQESHDPCSCEQVYYKQKKVQSWLSQNLKNAANIEWIKQNAKICPQCRVPIQKNDGCNHMQCNQCKFEFCWLCLQDWKKHSGTSYICNKFKDNDQNQGTGINKDKSQLEKYLFFFERWDNNLKLQINCQDVLYQQMEQLTQTLYKRLQINSIQLDFLTQSVNSLKDCRRILKWSYTYGFFIKDQSKRLLFEFQQKDFEIFCNKLHERCQKIPQIPDFNVFQKFQLEIQNLKISCEQYMKNFLDGVKNEQF